MVPKTLILHTALLLLLDPRCCEAAAEGSSTTELKFVIGNIGLFADRDLHYRVAPQQNYTVFDMYNKTRTNPENLAEQAYVYNKEECDLTNPVDYRAIFPDVPGSFTYWRIKGVPLSAKDAITSPSALRTAIPASPSVASAPFTPLEQLFFELILPPHAAASPFALFQRQMFTGTPAVPAKTSPTSGITTNSAPGTEKSLTSTATVARLEAAKFPGVGALQEGTTRVSKAVMKSEPIDLGISRADLQDLHNWRDAAEKEYGTEMVYFAPPPEFVNTNVTFCFQLIDKTSGYKAHITFYSSAPSAGTALSLSISIFLALFYFLICS